MINDWLYKSISDGEFKEFCLTHRFDYIKESDISGVRNVTDHHFTRLYFCGFTDDKWFIYGRYSYIQANAFYVRVDHCDWLIMKFEDDWWLLIPQDGSQDDDGGFLCDGLDGVNGVVGG